MTRHDVSDASPFWKSTIWLSESVETYRPNMDNTANISSQLDFDL